MSLSTLAGPRLSSRVRRPIIVLVRNSSIHHGRELFDGHKDIEPAKIKMQLPGNPKGSLLYERYVSNDPNYKYQLPGDTWARLLFGRIKEEKAFWGLFFMMYIGIPVFIAFTAIWSFLKIEVWVDRTRYANYNGIPGDDVHRSPWDWERIRDNYWKKPIQWFHRENFHKRLPEMELLQDTMLEEAKKRGTAKSLAQNAKLKKNDVRAAFQYWENHTCLDYQEGNTTFNRIRVYSGDGCHAYLGRIVQWETQDYSHGPDCTLGVAIHEIGYSIGLFYQQSRYDRDTYVQINLGNIMSGQEDQYRKETEASSLNYDILYDYGSIMHYGDWSFANSSSTGPTMTAIKPWYQKTMGQQTAKASLEDLHLVNTHYGCFNSCPENTRLSKRWLHQPQRLKQVHLPRWIFRHLVRSTRC